MGNALCPVHHEEDTRIMLDMGVNAVRLAHYPQATYMYDLMDKHGIVTWAEIPFVGREDTLIKVLLISLLSVKMVKSS